MTRKKKTPSASGLMERYVELREACRGDDNRFLEGLRRLEEESRESELRHWHLFFQAKIAELEGCPDDEIGLYSELAHDYADSVAQDEAIATSWALFNKGGTLGSQGDTAGEIACYDAVLTRFGDSEVPALQEKVAAALCNKGVALSSQGDTATAISCYDAVLTRFGDSAVPALQKQVGIAHFNKGVTLGSQGDTAGEIACYDAVLSRFGDSAVPALQEQVAIAHFNKGVTLGSQGDTAGEIACYDAVLSRFGDSAVPALQELVAKILVNKGVVLGRKGNPVDEISCYDAVLTRFGDSAVPALQEQVAKALINKGVTLSSQGDIAAAIVCYDDVVTRFCTVEVSALQGQRKRALTWKGRMLSKQGQHDDAIRCFDQALAINVPEEKPMHALALTDKALELKSKPEEVRRLIEEAKSIYPEIMGYWQSAAFGQLTKSIDAILDSFKLTEINGFRKSAKDRGRRTSLFLGARSAFKPEPSLLFVLREWNSFTPAVPDRQEIDRGGGYFIRYKKQGIIIDPGFDFIENFSKIGGRMCDVHHIIVTHAHNDHTQDFETLLTLVHEFNRQNRNSRRKVHLYLSQGALRKFSGHLPLRGAGHVGRIEVMTQGRKNRPQVIPLEGLEGAKLTVLRAYHDDLLTLDYSVGIHLNLDFEDGPRTLLFTSDSGLYPPLMNEKGQVERTPEDEKALDFDPLYIDAGALYSEYPNEVHEPDLMIAHIGAVQQYELDKIDPDRLLVEKKELPPMFYPDHLGIRGTAILLDKVRPRAAIISEFGEELKDIRFALARGINKYLQGDEASDQLRVLPGDLTLVYDIGARAFLCHQDGKFHLLDMLDFHETNEPDTSPFFSKGRTGNPVKRTYLFMKPAPGDDDAYDAVEDFYKSRKRNGGHAAWCSD